jgi:hypothetical protein
MGHVLDGFKAVQTATQVGVFLNVLSALGKVSYEPHFLKALRGSRLTTDPFSEAGKAGPCRV